MNYREAKVEKLMESINEILNRKRDPDHQGFIIVNPETFIAINNMTETEIGLDIKLKNGE